MNNVLIINRHLEGLVKDKRIFPAHSSLYLAMHVDTN